MNNFLTTLAMLLIVVLTALFAVPLMINWDDYRRDFEVRLSDILGARVELDGSLNVRLLPSPYVRAENLRIGESGIKGRPILEVKELTLFVSVPPMLRGLVEASRVSLEQPKLVLQFDKSGRPTFKTAADLKAKPGTGSIRVQDATLSGFKLSPKLISLKNVNIRGGEIAVRSLSGGPKNKAREFSVAEIDGILSAVTLNGPFYFNGGYQAGETRNNVRLALGAEDREGYALEGYVDLPQEDRVTFKGQLETKAPSWRINGTLKAGLGAFSQIAAADVAEVNAPQGPENNAKNQKTLRTLSLEEAVVVSSSVDLTPLRLKLNKIDIRGGSLAKPQTIKGQAVIDWQKALSLTARIDGQLIDLNAIYGKVMVDDAGTRLVAVQPAAALQALGAGLYTHAHSFEKLDVAASFQQLMVGRGDVRDAVLKLTGDETEMRVEAFEARLPGSGRITIGGRFERTSNVPRFEGDLFLRGLQFDQFLSWSAPDVTVAEQFGRGKFMFSGSVALTKDGLQVDDVLGDIGNTSLRLRYKQQKGEDLSGASRLNVIASEVDVAELIGRPVDMREYRSAIASVMALGGRKNPAKQSGENAKVIGETTSEGSEYESDDNAPLDMTFQIEKLIFSDATLRQVDLTLSADNQPRGGAHGKWGAVRSFSLTSEKGARVSYEAGGAVSDGLGRYVIEAENRSALEDLIDMSGIEIGKGLEFDARFVDRLLPLRLAVLREDRADNLHHRIDGVLSGNDAAFSVLAPSKPGAGPVTIFGGIENRDGRAVAAMLLPFEVSRVGEVVDEVANLADGPKKAQLTFLAKGSMEQGFRGQLSFNQNGLSMQYDGVLGFGGRRFASDGVFRIEAEKSREALTLFGYEGLPLTKEQEGPMKGEMTFVHTETGYAISDMNARFGETRMKGTGLMEVLDGTENLRLAISTSALSLSSVLAPLEQAGEGKLHGKVWSRRRFASSEQRGAARGVQRGSYSLALNELSLTDQLSLSDVRILWQSDGERIEVTRFEGKALGGVMTAKGILRPLAEGMSLNGLLTLKGGLIEEIGGRSEVNLGSGTFDLNLSLGGEGTSVEQLVASLVGEGSIAVKEGRLNQVAPARLRVIGQRFLNGDGDRGELKGLLEAEIDKSRSLMIGNIDLGLRLIDGKVKLRQPDLGVKPGQVGVEGALDLKTLSFNGAFVIDPKGAGVLQGLPPIYRRMQGSFDLNSQETAKLDADDFTRHLDLKYKEKELRILEKERSEEGERRRLDAERLEEAARARALEEEQKRKRAVEKELKSNGWQDDLDWSELPDLQP